MNARKGGRWSRGSSMSGCGAVGSAQRLGRWGRWFESSHPDHHFPIPLEAAAVAEHAELRAQAAALRRQGFSYSQIGRRLGIHKSVIARWVATVPFDGFNAESRAEQLQAVRDPHLYNRALELRQAGWSYKMIEDELGVPRSTLSGWLRYLKVQGTYSRADREGRSSNKRDQLSVKVIWLRPHHVTR